MKKILIVMMMALLVLAGCTAKDDTDTPDGDVATDVTLEVAGLEGGYGTEGWEAVVAAFTEETGIKVNLTLSKIISDELRPNIQAGEVPDVIYLGVGAIGGLTDTMIAEKIITDISDIVDEPIPGETGTVGQKVLPGFFDTLRSQPYSDGKIFLSPVFYSPLGMFYNAGLFEEKGWTVPTTWDEMWELGDKAKAEGIALFTYPTTGYFDGFFSSLLNITAGPEAYDKLMNFDLDTWKSDDVKRAFEIVGKLAEYTHENTVAQANEEGFSKNQSLVLENKALFIPNGTWLPGEMADAPREDGFKWGFTALPADGSGDEYSSTFTEEVYIPEGAEHTEQAKMFIAYLYSDEATTLFIENSGAVQPTVNAYELIPAEIDGEPNENKLYYGVYDGGAKSNSIGFADRDAVEGVDLTGAEGIIYGTVNTLVNGDITVEEWYNNVLAGVEQYQEQ